MNRVNLHISHGNFKHPSRILKETRSLSEAGLVDEIYIVALWDDGLEEHERLDEKRQVWRVRLRMARHRPGLIPKLMLYIEWITRVFLRFRGTPVKFVNCHSLTVLPIGLLFKVFSKSIVVYDTHELETETTGLAGIMQVSAKLIERISIRWVDAVITVNESIAEWYRNEYGLKNVYTVRNIPYQQDDGGEAGETGILKNKSGIRSDEILFIYHGGLTPGRGIDILLDVFANLDRRKQIVFMGYGEYEEVIRKYEQTHPNIHFQDAVSPQEVHRYASSADVGICLYENVSLNHYLCLPNKVFEYIMSGLPLIVSDFPEMRQVVDGPKCGWTVAVDGDALLTLVSAISWDDIMDRRNGVLRYRETIGWSKEEEILLQVYRGFGEGGGGKLVS